MEKDSVVLCQDLDACFLPMVVRGGVLTPNSSQVLEYKSAECWHFFPAIPPVCGLCHSHQVSLQRAQVDDGR